MNTVEKFMNNSQNINANTNTSTDTTTDTTTTTQTSRSNSSIGSILNSILDGTHTLPDVSKNILTDVSDQILSSEKFWIDDPMVLIADNKLLTIWPTENMSRNEKLNTLSRLVIYITLIGFIFTYSFKILVSGIVTLGVFIFLYYSTKNNSREEFCNFGSIQNFYTSPDITDRFTMPSETNPTMNVMLPEINDNPERNMAGPSYNPVIAEQINNSAKDMIVTNFDNDNTVRDKLFNDLGDNFQFEQSMRNFYTTASTTVPNNQGDFAKFCYGDMISCKEGNNLACVRHNPNHVNI